MPLLSDRRAWLRPCVRHICAVLDERYVGVYEIGKGKNGGENTEMYRQTLATADMKLEKEEVAWLNLEDQEV